MNLSRAGIAAMLVAAGCSQQPDASKKSPSSTAVPAPSPSLQARADVIEPSPTMSFEAPLPADQTPESIGSTIGRAAAMLVMKTATGIPRLMYWPAGAPAPFFVV